MRKQIPMNSQPQFGMCGTTELTGSREGTDAQILVFDSVTGGTHIRSIPDMHYMLTSLKHTCHLSHRKTAPVADRKVTHASVPLTGNVVRQADSVAKKVLTVGKAGEFTPTSVIVESELC
jgi:hypothetical protein